VIRRIALCAAVAAALSAGCGDDNGGGGGGGDASQPPRDTFASTCGGCHVLAAAGTEGQTGPNLDDVKPDKAAVLSAIADGPSIMPANLLEGEAADRVAQYVADNAGK
jgi:sulfite dehydrogenase